MLYNQLAVSVKFLKCIHALFNPGIPLLEMSSTDGYTKI